MIRHVVAFKLSATTDAEQKKSNAAGMKSALEALGELVPDIINIKVHYDIYDIDTHFDVVLIADYPTRAALEAYEIHPAHIEAVAFITLLFSDFAIVDFEL
jgi:hypothetical protein